MVVVYGNLFPDCGGLSCPSGSIVALLSFSVGLQHKMVFSHGFGDVLVVILLLRKIIALYAHLFFRIVFLWCC